MITCARIWGSYLEAITSTRSQQKQPSHGRKIYTKSTKVGPRKQFTNQRQSDLGKLFEGENGIDRAAKIKSDDGIIAAVNNDDCLFTFKELQRKNSIRTIAKQQMGAVAIIEVWTDKAKNKIQEILRKVWFWERNDDNKPKFSKLTNLKLLYSKVLIQSIIYSIFLIKLNKKCQVVKSQW